MGRPLTALRRPCLLLLMASAVWALQAPCVYACATCNVGDPTLTTFGLGQPFAQRLRLGARYDMRTTRIGSGTPDGFRLRHHETALLLAYTPTQWLTLDVDLPLVHRQVGRRSGAESRTTHVGDATAGLRIRLWGRQRIGRGQHLWSVIRLRTPTAPTLRGANGALRPLEEQTGSGAFVPQLGLGYARTGGVLSAFASARVELPLGGFEQSRPGPGLFVTLAAQWQPRSWFGVRLGWEQGYELSARELDGSVDPDSGGVLWSASLSLLFSPTPDMVVQLGGQVPLWQHLQGRHEELPVVQASVIFDVGGD